MDQITTILRLIDLGADDDGIVDFLEAMFPGQNSQTLAMTVQAYRRKLQTVNRICNSLQRLVDSVDKTEMPNVRSILRQAQTQVSEDFCK